MRGLGDVLGARFEVQRSDLSTEVFGCVCFASFLIGSECTSRNTNHWKVQQKQLESLKAMSICGFCVQDLWALLTEETYGDPIGGCRLDLGVFVGLHVFFCRGWSWNKLSVEVAYESLAWDLSGIHDA